MCCFPPVVHYQGDLIRATFDSEPIGEDEVADLLYLNFKAPDYAGHVYNMDDPRQAEVLGAVDDEIGRLADLLSERFGDGRSVLIVTADHGQCPEIDGETRIDLSGLPGTRRGDFVLAEVTGAGTYDLNARAERLVHRPPLRNPGLLHIGVPN